MLPKSSVIIGVSIALFFSSFVWAQPFQLAGDRLVENNGTQQLVYDRGEFCMNYKDGYEVFAVMKTDIDFIPKVAVQKNGKLINLFNVPNEYRRVITAVTGVSFLGNRKACIEFHSNPLRTLYMLYDFTEGTIDYYYCSNIFYDSKQNSVVYLVTYFRQDIRKFNFDLYINSVYTKSFQRDNPYLSIIGINSDERKIAIETRDNTTLEIEY
jgi:hypothetical protein